MAVKNVWLVVALVLGGFTVLLGLNVLIVLALLALNVGAGGDATNWFLLRVGFFELVFCLGFFLLTRWAWRHL